MRQTTRAEVLEKLRRRYQNAGSEHKRKLLDQAQELLGYHRKAAIYHGAEPIAQLPRPPGRRAVIDYRHVIEAVLRKPGAFARYHYREELFPSSTYRRAYDRLVRDHGARPGELEYLRLLKLTAELGINAVEGLLGELLGPQAGPWRTASLRSTLCPPPHMEVAEPTVDLSWYDTLLTPEVAHVA